MISIFAPDGIGEITEKSELSAQLVAAIDNDPAGPLADGDIIVVTSKIISKAEGRKRPAAERAEAIQAEAVRTVARKGQTAIVQTRHGLTMAAAGIDNSNVESTQILLLPVDPDASAERLRREIAELYGVQIGVIISDTSGRTWRIGQTDLAIGAAGVRMIENYAGRQDSYGNDLHVTAMALADELAAAADLVKAKLNHRPVAVIRGLAHLVRPEAGEGAVALIRPGTEDLFGLGIRESVIMAVLTALGRSEEYEQTAAIMEPDKLVAAILGDPALTSEQAEILEAVLRSCLG